MPEYRRNTNAAGASTLTAYRAPSEDPEPVSSKYHGEYSCKECGHLTVHTLNQYRFFSGAVEVFTVECGRCGNVKAWDEGRRPIVPDDEDPFR